MTLIVRIDVDRPYGRAPLLRHVASRISSDYYLPRIEQLGYLRELLRMLQMLTECGVAAHVFFRKCTLPSAEVLEALDRGRHVIGLHLENSRSFETFADEKTALERCVGRPVRVMSKHGSGAERYGRRHHAPYEPEKYLDWAHRSGMSLLLGNLEDPTLVPLQTEGGVTFHPSAFWLEPYWRDCTRFTIDWLIDKARTDDVVMLVHPENVFAQPALAADFQRVVENCEPKVQS
jgi:hypothetical protein